MSDTLADEGFMQAALTLGRGGLGLTAPNPSVGALVVRDGDIVGRGVTLPGGRPHAETVALEAAGAAARGATLYVTLEPCSHFGQTPPCVDAVVAAGIVRVVAAMVDPDPRVSGQGFARLRAAGINVDVGLGAAAAQRDHRGYVLRVTKGRPMVTLKLAETLDGFAAGAPGSPRLMITGAKADGHTQAQRAAHDAVMVGVGTVLADDSRLNVRAPGFENRRPLRIVLDPSLRTPPRAQLVATAARQPTLIICGRAADPGGETALQHAGVEIWRMPQADDLAAILLRLGARGLTRVLCEGGPTLAKSLILGGWADEIIRYTGPRPLGFPALAAFDEDTDAALARDYVVQADAMFGEDRMRHYERRS